MQHVRDNIIPMYSYVLFCLTIAFPAYAAEVTNVTYVDGTRNGSSGVITSPGYPENYPDNVNYTWILENGHPKTTVTFTILDVNIKPFIGHDCDDYLQIDEIFPFWRALKRCGQFPLISLKVTGERIAISFVSDEYINAKGFNLTWKVHLPELLTTLVTQTPPITTRTPNLTTTLSTTPVTTPTLTTTLKTTWITTRTTPATTPSTLKTTVTATISQPLWAPTTSPHVSTTFSSSTIKRTKEKTSSILTATTKSAETTTNTTEMYTSTKGNISPSLNPFEIMYLILGIFVAEFILIVFGICIIKRRRKDSSINANNRDIQEDKVRPVSRKSVMSVAHVYESIPLDHFFHDAILEEDEKEGMYVDLPEHVYDRQYVHRPHHNEKFNVYEVIVELKNKKA